MIALNNRIVCLNGQLGNQLFQIALAKYVQTIFNKNVLLVGDLDNHLGELCNELELEISSCNVRGLYWRPISTLLSSLLAIDSPEQVLTNKQLDKPVLAGYWQSRHYITNTFLDIYRNWLRAICRVDNVYCNSGLGLQFDKNFYSLDSACIQVRLGDFKNTIHDVLTDEYYASAMSNMYSQGVRNFFVASNDISQAMSMIKILGDDLPNIHIEPIHSKNYFSDFCLLSNCQNLIISNSSFGWWAGIDVKNVIAPRQWYTTEEVNNDFFNPAWNLLDVRT